MEKIKAPLERAAAIGWYCILGGAPQMLKRAKKAFKKDFPNYREILNAGDIHALEIAIGSRREEEAKPVQDPAPPTLGALVESQITAKPDEVQKPAETKIEPTILETPPGTRPLV